MKFSLIILSCISLLFPSYMLIDATSYDDWVYINLSGGGSVLTPEEVSVDSQDWDIACQRYHFRTNSGLSGNANGGAYVDSVNTNLYYDMEVSVVQENSSGEDVLLSSPIIVSSLDDSIAIPMGYVLRAYQSGKLDIYDKFKLKTGGNLYNYSQLSIKNNPRLDIMYTK